MSKDRLDKKLLARLLKAEPNDIDYLVDIITDFGRGRASLSSKIKETLVFAKNKPAADRYDEDILITLIKELQEYSGNSVMNTFRSLFDRPFVSYDELVDDVYTKLNGRTAKRTEAKEKEISLALFGDDWIEITDTERYAKSTGGDVVSGGFDLEKPFKTHSFSGYVKNNYGVLLGTLTLPLTSTVATYKALSEAYRITIPFVAQMGYIALKSELPSKDVFVNTETEEVIDKHVVLYDENENTLVEFIEIDRDINRNKSFQPDKVNSLNSLLSAVPGVMALAEQQTNGYVLCNIPLENLAKTKGSDTFRGFVKSAVNGRIEKHVELSSPEKLQNIMMSGVAWNALSVAVAQKHLQDINEKLTEVINKLDDLKQCLKEDKKDELQGLQNYVQSLLDFYDTEEFNESTKHALENHLATVYKLESYFFRQIEIDLEDIYKIDHDSIFNADKVKETVLFSLGEITNTMQSYYNILQMRIVICAFLYKSYKSERYASEALKALDKLNDMSPFTVSTQQYCRAKFGLSSSAIFSDSAQLSEQLEKGINKLIEGNKVGEQGTIDLYNFLLKKTDFSLYLKIEDGIIVSDSV